MKKLFSIIAFLAFSIGVSAQTDVVLVHHGAALVDTISYVDSIEFKNIVFKPHFVDLGLSVRWADINVGASRPEEGGSKFMWGFTEVVANANATTYATKFGSKKKRKNQTTGKSYTMQYSKYGMVDDKFQLDSIDDAATVILGPEYRTPTNDELTELRTQCSWTPDTINGRGCYKITGPNGNSIWMRASGTYIYMSSSIGTTTSTNQYAYGLLLRLSAYNMMQNDIDQGFMPTNIVRQSNTAYVRAVERK